MSGGHFWAGSTSEVEIVRTCFDIKTGAHYHSKKVKKHQPLNVDCAMIAMFNELF